MYEVPVLAAGAGDREVGGCIKRLTSLPSPRLSFPSLWRGGCASFIPPTLLLTYTTYLFNHLPTSALSCVCEPGHMPKLIIKQSRQNPTTTYTNSWWKLASRCLMPNFQSILPIVNCTKCCKRSILSARKRRGSYEFMDSGKKIVRPCTESDFWEGISRQEVGHVHHARRGAKSSIIYRITYF